MLRLHLLQQPHLKLLIAVPVLAAANAIVPLYAPKAARAPLRAPPPALNLNLLEKKPFHPFPVVLVH